MSKIVLLVIGSFLVGGAGMYLFLESGNKAGYKAEEEAVEIDTRPSSVVADTEEKEEEEVAPEYMTETVLGTSVKGNDITAYHFGSGDNEALFVGGIHGGYSWNTALLANELVEYLEDNESSVPSNTKVTVIPVLNPDGLNTTTGSTDQFLASDVDDDLRVKGRFNANGVDINRNFDCQWEESGTWQNQTVSGGSEPFSEPEAAAIKSYVDDVNPEAVVVYYSSAGGVYASNCNSGILPETRTLTNNYANAAGYEAFEEFDFYDITGDMVNWLAKEKVPAISVLLTSHTYTEWEKNIAGIESVISFVSKQ